VTNSGSRGFCRRHNSSSLTYSIPFKYPPPYFPCRLWQKEKWRAVKRLGTARLDIGGVRNKLKFAGRKTGSRVSERYRARKRKRRFE
jgi:hypothetical protein